jgi:hypothetical protein
LLNRLHGILWKYRNSLKNLFIMVLIYNQYIFQYFT